LSSSGTYNNNGEREKNEDNVRIGTDPDQTELAGSNRFAENFLCEVNSSECSASNPVR